LRVNITYSVELEEVPNEIARILEECEQNMVLARSEIESALYRDPLDQLAALDNIRVSLAKIDLKLGDSMEILSGYLQAVAKKPEIEQAAIDEHAQRLAALASQLENTDGAKE